MTRPDGSSPLPRESSPDGALFGTTTRGKPRRRSWRIEIEGRGNAGAPRSTEVRVMLVDAETGKRIAAQTLPFSWLVDVVHDGTAVVTLAEGDWS
jgi:hypothetical protein